ncbi:unnamed protein product [Rotaria magnacalcarata]|nr:unnamed protein product [Rotaria magnacalcarata]CAF1627976.1 unnamed protein product [Rotaria magnacalcarata]CAF3952408.1 unnamed protein product [Rotaria magnacalcarata]
MSELLNGGLIRLPGASGSFNPDLLLEPSWLQEKMTMDEYRSTIEDINKYTRDAHLPTKNLIWPRETHEREEAKAEAGQLTVLTLNDKHRAVRFTYHQSVEKNEVYSYLR